MCFITKGTKLKIAFKDIECYKIVEKKDINHCVSYHVGFEYEYNKKYSNKSRLTLFLLWLFDINVKHEGYHSFIYPVFGSLIKCVIPKGSLYLVNPMFNEYCSTSIIIKKP